MILWIVRLKQHLVLKSQMYRPGEPATRQQLLVIASTSLEVEEVRTLEPLEENVRVYAFDAKFKVLCSPDPKEASSFAVALSYQSSKSINKERTKDPVGGVLSRFDDHGTIFIHGACTASG